MKVGKPTNVEAARNGTKLARGANFRCLLSDMPISGDYIKAEGKAGRMGSRLMAVVAEGDRGRVYLPPIPEHESVARQATPEWAPDAKLFGKCRVNVSNYGLDCFGDLFTPRQLVALTTFSDLVGEAMERVRCDAADAGLPDAAADDPRRGKPLREGGSGARAYAEAVALLLAFVLDKQADLGNSLCRWEPVAQCPRQLFGRQAIPMIWDFAEGNPIGGSSGGWPVFVDGISKAFSKTF